MANKSPKLDNKRRMNVSKEKANINNPTKNKTRARERDDDTSGLYE
jgi:hypothetical protein